MMTSVQVRYALTNGTQAAPVMSANRALDLVIRLLGDADVTNVDVRYRPGAAFERIVHPLVAR